MILDASLPFASYDALIHVGITDMELHVFEEQRLMKLQIKGLITPKKFSDEWIELHGGLKEIGKDT
jgi:hypothetical protein